MVDYWPQHSYIILKQVLKQYDGIMPHNMTVTNISESVQYAYSNIDDKTVFETDNSTIAIITKSTQLRNTHIKSTIDIMIDADSIGTTVDDRRSQLCAEMYREIYEEFRRKMNYFVDECNSDPSDEIDYDNIIGDFE